MGDLPVFHSRAAREAAARSDAARDEKDRADDFLSELDDLLGEAAGSSAG